MKRGLFFLMGAFLSLCLTAQEEEDGFGVGWNENGGGVDNLQQFRHSNRAGNRRGRNRDGVQINDTLRAKMMQFMELTRSGKYSRGQMDSIRKVMGIPDMAGGGRGGSKGDPGRRYNPRGGPLESMPDINGVSDLTLDSLYKADTARPKAGSSRMGDNPVLFLVGNSTMRTGTMGNGDNGQWGWGYFFHEYFDLKRISVENHALGGTSSRTFYNRLWPAVYEGIRPGDWVLIELGHNDNGPFDFGRARASIKGIGRDSLIVTIQETGAQEIVYSYGEYLRRFVRDVKRRYAHPVILSLTPRNDWKEGKIVRVDSTFGLWAKQVAREERIPFIDLNDITALRFEKYGPEKVNTMFYGDKIHSSEFGARENARSAAEGIARSRGLELKNFLKPMELPQVKINRTEGKPLLLLTGDSTMKNEDKEGNDSSMWGWGSVAAQLFDTARIDVINCGMAGRSTRTFLDEGRWDKVVNSVMPGDYVAIQFGHNDMGSIEKGKARGVLPGTSDSSHVFMMEASKKYKVVYTFGWYLRKFVNDVRANGGIPVLLSLTPHNDWHNGKIERLDDTYGKWMREVAEQTGAVLIDIHNLTADYLQRSGDAEAKSYYQKDHTHTSKKGAMLNARMFAEGLKKSDCTLKEFLK